MCGFEQPLPTLDELDARADDLLGGIDIGCRATPTRARGVTHSPTPVFRLPVLVPIFRAPMRTAASTSTDLRISSSTAPKARLDVGARHVPPARQGGEPAAPDDRYITKDPIGLRPYGYVEDPTTWCDPVGLSGCRVKVIGDSNFFMDRVESPPLQAIADEMLADPQLHIVDRHQHAVRRAAQRANL